MPIFVHVNFKQEPLFCRGHRIGIIRLLKLWLGIPMTFKSFASEDVYRIAPRSVSYLQAFSDDEFQRRKAAREAEIEKQKKAAEEARKRNPNPGDEPKKVIPSGKNRKPNPEVKAPATVQVQEGLAPEPDNK
jgi:hypothetical protein